MKNISKIFLPSILFFITLFSFNSVSAKAVSIDVAKEKVSVIKSTKFVDLETLYQFNVFEEDNNEEDDKSNFAYNHNFNINLEQYFSSSEIEISYSNSWVNSQKIPLYILYNNLQLFYIL